jgi:glycosyltransferase involved in cell wall biosynthesis
MTMRLSALGVQLVHVSTRPTGATARFFSSARRAGVDANAFLAHYPVTLNWPEADVYHLTTQTYASALAFRPPPGPVVVTVHDIIPHLVRHDRRLCAYRHPVHRLFDRISLRGLKAADALLADSRWTKDTVVRDLGIPGERITFAPLGVDRARYRPLRVDVDLLLRYGLNREHRYILYVGSEDPRKNLEVLWRAFADVYRREPDVRLIKVGRPHVMAERQRLLEIADDLGITEAIQFFDDVPETDMPYLYNAAAVVALPSLYEGFGFPVIEAAACGTPVVCSNRTALAELGGPLVTLVEPTIEAFATSLTVMLEGGPTRRFRMQTPPDPHLTTWDDVTEQVVSVYRRVVEGVAQRPTAGESAPTAGQFARQSGRHRTPGA